MPLPIPNDELEHKQRTLFDRLTVSLPGDAASMLRMFTDPLGAYTIEFGKQNSNFWLQLWLDGQDDGEGWSMNFPVWLYRKIERGSGFRSEDLEEYDNNMNVKVDHLKEEEILAIFLRAVTEYLK